MRRLGDLVMGALAGLLICVFFRQVEVVDAAELHAGIPMVLVANHQNGLVDGLLLMAALRRYPRFLAKSTLFHIVPLVPFLKLAGVVPVYRADDGQETAKNSVALAAARRLLGRGGLVAVFPEGISHDEPTLQPLKTGAARIALGAGIDDGVTGVVTVAVGLAYDQKARFRSRALVRVGPAEPVDRWVPAYRADPHAAVHRLTDDLADRLRSVGPDYPSWVAADRWGRIAEVVDRPAAGSGPREVALSRREDLARALGAAEGRAGRAGEVRALDDAFARYERDLSLAGLTDAQMAPTYRPARLRAVLAWSTVKVVLALPFAVAGALVHAVPYQLVKGLARLPSNEGVRSTVKLAGCFATFTLLYAGLGVGVGLGVGPLAGAVAGGGAPICGYVTVLFAERLARIRGAVAGARATRRWARPLRVARHDRAVVVALATALLASEGRP